MQKRGTGHISRRVRQSFTHFRNGPRILTDIARRRDVTFRTRTGLTLTAPREPGAMFPVFEIHADDVYRIDDLLDGVRPDPVVVDIGAHIGSFSTAVCAARPDATVHAFEASPSTADWLDRNVASNDLAARLHVHRTAVAGHRGSLDFVDNGSASAHNGLTAPDGLGAVVSVPCITFDDVHAEVGQRIDVVKSDAEGAEYDYILGSDPAHWSTVDRVVMEYHPVDGHDLGELTAYFAAVGLDLVRDEPGDRAGLGNAWFARRS